MAIVLVIDYTTTDFTPSCTQYFLFVEHFILLIGDVRTALITLYLIT